MTSSQIAADYGISAMKLNRLLHMARVQRKVGGQWILYCDYMNRGLTNSETVAIAYYGFVSGKLSDDRFSRMSRRYEDEQVEVQSKIKTLKAELQKGKSQTMTGDMFISAVRKYTRIRKLTPRVLNELIEKIEVYHSEKKNGVQTQNITIHYNCIGSIEIPKDVPLELPQITLPTRRGVAVTYTPLASEAVNF